MNAPDPSIKKSAGASPWIVIALVLGAIIAWGTGSAILGVLLILALVAYMITRPSAPTATAPDLHSRVAFLERRVLELQDAVDKLRGTSRPAAEPKPAPARAAAPAPRPVAPPPRPAPPKPRPATPPAATRAFDWGRTISAADLMGAKALAFSGGIVTLLGVVFFFVLAVNRGWIGPELRVACGGVASAIVFGA